MSDPSEPLSDEWFDNLVAKMPYDDGGVGAVVRAVAAAALRWAADHGVGCMDYHCRGDCNGCETDDELRAKADAIEGER